MPSPLILGTYDPTDQTVEFNNTTITGYGPGTFIKVSYLEDRWILIQGIQGDNSRCRNPSTAGRFEFTLLASSPANALLSALADRDFKSGEGVGECFVKDINTRSAQCFAPHAWIVKPPDYERAKELGEITWTIECDGLQISHDGLLVQPNR